jgi:tripartite-type tricarboxylate transporter receptor subunit TctC
MSHSRPVSGVVLALMLMASNPAAAWPDQPLRIVVPFAAGGTTDVMARVIAERLSAHLGQPAVIENVPGSGGNNGAALVAKAAQRLHDFDGHAWSRGGESVHVQPNAV